MPTDTKLDTAAARRIARQITRDAVRKTAPKLHEVIKYPDPILMKKGEPVTEETEHRRHGQKEAHIEPTPAPSVAPSVSAPLPSP